MFLLRVLPKRFLATSLVAMLPLNGCAPTKTYFLPAGEPVQLAERVKVKVYADLDGDGVLELTQNRIVFEPGWWLVPDLEDEGE